MDAEESFKKIEGYIKDCRVGMVRPEVENIISSYPDDCWILIKCASMMRVVDDYRSSQEILDMVMKHMPDDREEKFSVALAIRNLGRKSEAYEIVRDYKGEKGKTYEIALTMLIADEVEEALSVVDTIEHPEPKEIVLKCDILCALDEAGRAHEIALRLNESEHSPDSLINLCNVLMAMGNTKEAVKLGRAELKKERNSADSYALAAYIMYTNGKISAAANFANRALTIDYSNVRALETMAMCLIEKKEFMKAKMLAGTINAQDPKDPAALRIIDACIAARS